MNKLIVRRFLNFLLWISVCVLAGTGSILTWKFPRGAGRGARYALLGADAHLWKEIHLWVGVLFVLLVIGHMYMAWPWLKSAAAGRKRLWAVLVGLLAGVSIPVLLWVAPVQSRVVSEPATASAEVSSASARDDGTYGKAERLGGGRGEGKGRRQRE